MRVVALLFVVACGSQPDHPFLANAPKPDVGAVAGVAAAAAAAATFADPDAATRKPEKKQNENMREVEVKENVPKDVFDRLETGSGSNAASPAAVDKTKAKPHKGPPPKLPSPEEAAKRHE